MIKRLCKLIDRLPLVKDLVAHQGPCLRRGGNILLYSAVSCKNISHTKLEVIRMEVYFFLNMVKQTKGKIIVDIIRKDEST